MGIIFDLKLSMLLAVGSHRHIKQPNRLLNGLMTGSGQNERVPPGRPGFQNVEWQLRPARLTFASACFAVFPLSITPKSNKLSI